MNINKIAALNLDSEINKSMVDKYIADKDILNTVKALVKPVAYYCDIKSNERVYQEIIMGSKYLREGLKTCEEMTLIAITIGYEISNYVNDCFEKGNYYEQYIVDEAASFIVEAGIEKLHNKLIFEKSKRGFSSSPRYSAGYGDIELSLQGEILNILKTSTVIMCNDSYMLNPVKSVTAIIGWSKEKINQNYPTGDKSKGLCQGGESCYNCKTWACRK